VVRRRPLTGVCRRRRSPARHSCRVPLGQRHGARPVAGPSRWDGLGPDGFRKGIKMSRNDHGEPWQSDSNGSRRMRSRPERRSQIPDRDRPARKNKYGQDARAPRRSRPRHRHGEKPRERGLRFATGSKPRPGVKRRAKLRLRRRRPVNGPWLSARVGRPALPKGGASDQRPRRGPRVRWSTAQGGELPLGASSFSRPLTSRMRPRSGCLSGRV
jgi:hypothetical protein